MTGTFINVATVILGTGLGTLFGTHLPVRVRETTLHVLGLLTLVVGKDAALHAPR